MTIPRTTHLGLILLTTVFYTVAFAVGQEAHPAHGTTTESRDHGDHAGHDEHDDHDEHESHDDHEGHDDHAGHDDEGVVRLTEEELDEFDIEVATAGPGTLRIHVTLPGETRVNEERLAHIVPRFPGVAKDVRKRLGDKVKEGEVLAVMEGNESLAPYEIKSLIEGTVIQKHITLGEVLTDEDDAFVVADLSSVWVDLSVYQKDLPYVKKGQRVTITAGHSIPDATGEISYVGPVLDEHTRTGLARVLLPNPNGHWRPGLFITGRIEINELEVPLLVPKTALQTVEGEICVFILTDEGFQPRPVTIGGKNETYAAIMGGLEVGQSYAARGAFTLKAELSKGAFGDGHAH